jgi:hypothetical protein
MATKFNRNIKVSQATIDKIKKQGMTASLKSASSNNSPEYREALRRMYGDARVAKATASTKPSSSGRYVGSMFVPDKPAKTTSGGGKYVGSMFVPDKAPAKKASTSYSPAPMSAAAKAKATAAGAAKPKPKPKPKANGSGMNPVYDLIARAWYNTPKNQRDRRNAAKAAAAKKNK